ncbi:MAG TPA: DEAD/DEAH box helicase family protein, partial [Pyrinomonadaceae bacterium]|nr:DEAD/DEAH box helicase family protein [Pyrinomonadaceae bacterium]
MQVNDLILIFESGTLVLEGAAQDFDAPEAFVWDARIGQYRAPAFRYREIIKDFIQRKIDYDDRAKKYSKFDFRAKFYVEPRPYQSEAIAAWRKNERCGAVILPTGAGKTHVAQMAIELCGRQTLVVVPTLDLMNQWYDLLVSTFNAEIGLIGGGFYEIGAITVTTYASAFRHQERLGNQFGLIIFDECHHLPSEGGYAYAAEFAIAPFRLGLTATPERADGGEDKLESLVGKIVYRREAQEFAGEYLADYEIERVEVNLSPEEREAYEKAQAIYRQFIRDNRISFGGVDGWKMFVMQSARSEAGRRAMKAYRESKR